MALLSPGIETLEIDKSLIVNTAGTSFGAFCGEYTKGQANTPTYITTIPQYEQMFGLPTSKNYNEWFQGYCFLRLSGSLYVSRVLDSKGIDGKIDSTKTVTQEQSEGDSSIEVTDGDAQKTFCTGMLIQFEGKEGVYEVTNVESASLTISPALAKADELTGGEKVYICQPSMNAYGEAVKKGSVTTIEELKLKSTMKVVANDSDFNYVEETLGFSDVENSKLKFLSRNPGVWGNDIKIGIALKEDFEGTPKQINNVSVTDLFEYTPDVDEFCVVVVYKNEIVETFYVSNNVSAKDFNNKSMYVENVINRTSSYIFVKDNVGIQELPKSYTGSSSQLLALNYGVDGTPSKGDKVNCYNSAFGSKEEIDIDIVIANEGLELDIASFVSTRRDCVGIGGASYDMCVGVTADKAVDNMFFSIVGNYGYIYDSYNDKYRWINLAGATAGLRASTTNATNPWIASAGLTYGKYIDFIKLAFNPNKGHRDQLYKNSINPVCSFPDTGIVLWGQKTATNKPSAFDRVNIRMLFNYLERVISNSARYVIFEQNDESTRNMFVSMCAPVFDAVKAGRGIQDYRIICDDTNNTPQVVSENRFVATFKVKPLYAIEFITLNFVAVGGTISIDEA